MTNNKKIIEENYQINPEPTYFCVGKVRIDLKTGKVEFEKWYKPDETAQRFWEFISVHRPKFVEKALTQQKKEIKKELETIKFLLTPYQEYIGKDTGYKVFESELKKGKSKEQQAREKLDEEIKRLKEWLTKRIKELTIKKGEVFL